MQPEISTPHTRGESGVGPGTTGERETAGYISERGAGIGQTVGYYLQQPTIIGSIVMAIIGAIIGVRVAQQQAIRRRRRFYERWGEALGSLGAIVLTVMRIRHRRMFMQQMLRQRQRDLAQTTQGWSDLLTENMPRMGRVRMRAGGPAGTMRQVGSALSLIPPTLVLLRNPLVRGMVSRRMSRQMSRGIFGR